MKREILYRQPLGNGWHYWGLIDGEFVSPINLGKDSQQLIGVNDNNGSPIFEGDILRCRGGEEHQGHREYDVTGVTEFSHGTYSVVTKERVHYDFAYSDWDHIEVIGNIYEHSHLLS